jgi:hypothetical protein
MNNDIFLIWSIEHGAWWRPKQCGYTQSRLEAGIYSYKEAVKIVKEANKFTKDMPNEAMVPVDREELFGLEVKTDESIPLGMFAVIGKKCVRTA